MFLDFRSFSQVVEPRFEVQKIWGFFERELCRFCASSLFSNEKEREIFFFFWRERESAGERETEKRENIIFYSTNYFNR